MGGTGSGTVKALAGMVRSSKTSSNISLGSFLSIIVGVSLFPARKPLAHWENLNGRKQEIERGLPTRH